MGEDLFVKGLWRKFTSHEEKMSKAEKTLPIKEPAQGNSAVEQPFIEPVQLIAGCGQSVGKQREHNEDALFMLTTNLVDKNSNLPFGLYVVADGMGGHLHGEVASRLAIHIMASHVIQKFYLPLLTQAARPEESLQDILQGGIQSAHRSIMKDVPGGGTTLTAALVMGNQATIAHVGDSRGYLIDPNNRIESVTRDHSLVRRLVELGQITQEEAAVHPQRNVLYRALGQGEPFEPDISTIQLPGRGYLLLCSDGLWGVITEAEIYRLVISSPSPHTACQRLVEAANKGGGPDNITAVLIQLLQ